MPQIDMDTLTALRGSPVYAEDGDKIGEVEEIFYDDDTAQPEWIGIGTGFFGTKRVLVPLAGADVAEDRITVRFAKDFVKDSPDIDTDEISDDLERELYSYYSVEQPAGRSDTTQEPRSGERASVTRSEEELHVGKERVETGGIRLRKWVETEQVNVPVELRKEKVAVEREPLAGEAPSEIGGDEVEVTVSEERPVVEKRAVAKERITVDKDVETERETVAGEVRKERVEVDDSSSGRRR